MSDQFKFTRTFRKLVENTTINSDTLLSTDYLNHFNELVMMLDLIPDMPEMLDETKEWKPKTYAEHFQDSSFTHKDLAIAAYDHVLDADRKALEMTVARMDQTVEETFAALDAAVATGDADRTRTICNTSSQALQGMIDRCSGIINGVEGAAATAFAAMDESVPVLDVTKPAETEDEEEKIVMDQSAIDALFD
ncbi:hypothetical protein [Hwanghaeella sp.]|uniref:hypothetical protein n=1 Tax=Hwanghaeella sp. TaxID=2605943 RepID=UPI003CCB8884